MTVLVFFLFSAAVMNGSSTGSPPKRETKILGSFAPSMFFPLGDLAARNAQSECRCCAGNGADECARIKLVPNQLWTIVRALQSGLRERGFDIGKTNSPVTPVFLKGSLTEATNIVMDLRENYSIFCSIVTYPVVPKGVIMLRLIPSAIHTLADVEETLKAYTEVADKLKAGYYETKAALETNA